MIYFSSDIHYSHYNIIKYANRPFKSINEMNDKIISNFNSIIKDTDTLYLLGDTAFHKDQLNECLRRLNGKKFFINGNHDPKQFDQTLIEGRYDTKMIQVDNLNIWLSHYSHRVWPGAHYGSYHLFGHSHGKLEDYGNSCDVGVDCNNFMPVSLEDIKLRFLNRINIHKIPIG